MFGRKNYNVFKLNNTPLPCQVPSRYPHQTTVCHHQRVLAWERAGTQVQNPSRPIFYDYTFLAIFYIHAFFAYTKWVSY